MSKIYGYKEKDVIALAEFLRVNQKGKLTERFERFSAISGKAKGTVRNLYYALAKMSKTDQEFCRRYLGGRAIEVEKTEEFTKEQEEWLFEQILRAKADGRSVRSAIHTLAGGDEKKALRLQNKYRNAVSKSSPAFLTVKERLIKSGEIYDERQAKPEEQMISETQMQRLKSEINGLIARISLKERKENARLRERVEILERENLRLSNLLYGGAKKSAVSFFNPDQGNRIVH